MIYEAQGKRINLKEITRLYPAVIVEAAGEVAQVSLEWVEMKKDVIKVNAFVLVFDIDPLHETPDNRIELIYASKDELLSAMTEVAQYFEK